MKIIRVNSCTNCPFAHTQYGCSSLRVHDSMALPRDSNEIIPTCRLDDYEGFTPQEVAVLTRRPANDIILNRNKTK